MTILSIETFPTRPSEKANRPVTIHPSLYTFFSQVIFSNLASMARLPDPTVELKLACHFYALIRLPKPTVTSELSHRFYSSSSLPRLILTFKVACSFFSSFRTSVYLSATVPSRRRSRCFTLQLPEVLQRVEAPKAVDMKSYVRFLGDKRFAVVKASRRTALLHRARAESGAVELDDATPRRITNLASAKESRAKNESNIDELHSQLKKKSDDPVVLANKL